MSELSMGAAHMGMDTLLERISNIKNFCINHAKTFDTTWDDEVEALEAVTAILSTLQDEGISDAEGVKDLIFDYTSLSKQYKSLHAIHIKAGIPIHKDGIWHCPNCNTRTSFNHSFCHKCGKRLGGWKR